jgi:glycerol-3-phosphate dehydrogenase
MTSPDELGRALVEDARKAGADLREHVTVTKVVPEKEVVHVECSGDESYSARCVVNTSGPWIRTIDGSEGVDNFSGLWCKGFNLVCRPQFNPKHAVGIPSHDGRLFFIVPRGEGSVVGTWYTPVSEVSGRPDVSEEEVVTFIEAFNRAVPWWPLRLSDVIGTDVGYLPVKKISGIDPELYGSELIGSKGRMVEVLSTKYTTCLSQAEGITGVVKGILGGDRR